MSNDNGDVNRRIQNMLQQPKPAMTKRQMAEAIQAMGKAINAQAATLQKMSHAITNILKLPTVQGEWNVFAQASIEAQKKAAEAAQGGNDGNEQSNDGEQDQGAGGDGGQPNAGGHPEVGGGAPPAPGGDRGADKKARGAGGAGGQLLGLDDEQDHGPGGEGATPDDGHAPGGQGQRTGGAADGVGGEGVDHGGEGVDPGSVDEDGPG